MKTKNDMVIGEVATNKNGSQCEFEICTVGEWEAMSENEQQKELIRAMWDSGLIDVYVKGE